MSLRRHKIQLPRPGPRERVLAFHLLLAVVLAVGHAKAQALDYPGGTAVAEVPPFSTLEELRSILPPVPRWDGWLAASGERPPDFTRFPSEPGLVNPFHGLDLRGDPETWERVRQVVLGGFRELVYGPASVARSGKIRQQGGDGSVAEAPPGAGWRAVREVVDGEARGLVVGWVRGAAPNPGGRLVILCGRSPEAIPELLRRGWTITQAAGETSLAAETPVIARASARVRRLLKALSGERTRRPEGIMLLGRGLGGKIALWTAAQDDRVAAVLAVDSGPGGACPWRLWSEKEFGPGIEITTREHPDWFSPRLRFFVGRENRLPVDQHLLPACVAPRVCLLATALRNPAESAWAVEQGWRTARRVFAAAGVSDRFGLDVRDGAGEVSASDWRRWLDWLEVRVRSHPTEPPGKASSAETELSGPRFPDLADWLAAGGELLDPDAFPPSSAVDLLLTPAGQRITRPEHWPPQRARLRAAVRTVLGGDPHPNTADQRSVGRAADAWQPPPDLPAWLHAEPLTFGPGITGTVLYRTNVLGTTRRLPALVWLPPWSVPTGYRAAALRGEPPWRALTRSGSAVLVYDPAGGGSRIREGWRCESDTSLLGRLVADARAAVAALAQHPQVDPAQIFLLGCGLGGAVALHAAALDDAVAGALCIGGLTPWRRVNPTWNPDPLRSWTRRPVLLPRLARFAGREPQLPYDFDTLLALIAPRPVFVLANRLDPAARLEDVRECVEGARPVYALLGARDALVFQPKEDYPHFTPDDIWCLCNDAAQH